MRLTVPACAIPSRTARTALLFRAGGYARAVDERPETEERPESEPTSLEDGQSMEPGKGPHDRHPELEQLHGVPTNREQDEDR
jgi:hypothetical protein